MKQLVTMLCLLFLAGGVLAQDNAKAANADSGQKIVMNSSAPSAKTLKKVSPEPSKSGWSKLKDLFL
jgi:hypothetical protein